MSLWPYGYECSLDLSEELLDFIFLLMQIVMLISQIRVNSMAIVRMKSADVNGLSDLFRKSSHSEGALTSNVEQVVYIVFHFCSLSICNMQSLCDLSMQNL